jgi:hypothetical protein
MTSMRRLLWCLKVTEDGQLRGCKDYNKILIIGITTTYCSDCTTGATMCSLSSAGSESKRLKASIHAGSGCFSLDSCAIIRRDSSML